VIAAYALSEALAAAKKVAATAERDLDGARAEERDAAEKARIATARRQRCHATLTAAWIAESTARETWLAQCASDRVVEDARRTTVLAGEHASK
jgi:hypothetical protein